MFKEHGLAGFTDSRPRHNFFPEPIITRMLKAQKHDQRSLKKAIQRRMTWGLALPLALLILSEIGFAQPAFADARSRRQEDCRENYAASLDLSIITGRGTSPTVRKGLASTR